jgi:hypothetical protein
MMEILTNLNPLNFHIVSINQNRFIYFLKAMILVDGTFETASMGPIAIIRTSRPIRDHF